MMQVLDPKKTETGIGCPACGDSGNPGELSLEIAGIRTGTAIGASIEDGRLTWAGICWSIGHNETQDKFSPTRLYCKSCGYESRENIEQAFILQKEKESSRESVHAAVQNMGEEQ